LTFSIGVSWPLKSKEFLTNESCYLNLSNVSLSIGFKTLSLFEGLLSFERVKCKN